jgi:hypothetical protein
MTTGAGWWYTYPSEKYEFVSWDDDYSQWENKIHVPNLQPDDDWRIWRYPHDFGNLMIYHAEATNMGISVLEFILAKLV